jgi:hypothetical protein
VSAIKKRLVSKWSSFALALGKWSLFFISAKLINNKPSRNSELPVDPDLAINSEMNPHFALHLDGNKNTWQAANLR